MNRNIVIAGLMLLSAMGAAACAPLSPPATAPAQSASSTVFVPTTPPTEVSETSAPMSTTTTNAIPVTGHLTQPGTPVPGSPVADVISSGNAASYGDSYKINRFERPFRKDMTYVPDLDIVSFNLGEDADWYYVSIELNGANPNNPIGINYGVEIDLDADGFGDYLIWAHPLYTAEWNTSTVQVFKDSNHDSAGQSSQQSDAVSNGNGYDKLVFDGDRHQNTDPDLAWVRMQEGQHATIQFAFKKSWIGSSFAVGVLADAGLKKVSEYDYSDHFKQADAGSPIRSNPHYPLKSVYAIDNTCWQAYGIKAAVYQPKFCSAVALPAATHKAPENKPITNQLPTNQPPAPAACEPLPEDDQLQCENGYNPQVCQCNSSTEPPVETEPPAVTEPPQATEPPAQPPPPTQPPVEPPPATEAPAPTPPPA